MLKKLETKDRDLLEIVKHCNKKKIILISTPYTINDVDKLEKLNFPAYKIASMHLTEKNFIKHIIKKNKPIFLSTGMSKKSEIDEVLKLFNKKTQYICNVPGNSCNNSMFSSYICYLYELLCDNIST
mgnify:CR=1 FL=1